MAGVLFINDRDLDTDFGFKPDLGGFTGWPGLLAGASRSVPFLEGAEMQGALLDARLIRRKPTTATIKGRIETASTAAALIALDALRGLVMGGEVAVRSVYASDRHCLAVCSSFDGTPFQEEIINGNVTVSMTFALRDSVATRLVPDGYALSTTRTSCPIGTAESRPVIIVHGGGASLTNPTITVRNGAGDSVMTMGCTVVIGATAALRIDCARAQVSLITAGVITDGISYWTSGDFPLLRLYDGWVESAVYPSVELSASAGAAQGEITYTRAYA